MTLPCIETEDGFQTIINNKSYSVVTSHENYDALQDAVYSGNSSGFLTLFSKEQVIKETFEGTKVTVDDGVVYFEDEVLHNVVTDKIISLSERGRNPQSMINFLENLMENPSRRAVNELYNFLKHQKLPITEDGCFVAYKSVKSDWYDKYTGKTFVNKPGEVVEIRRNLVDDDKDQTCSYGLHVGALEYAGPGGWYNQSSDRVVLVKVNPCDAVSVPRDANGQKLRVCKYEVIGEYEQELDEDVYPVPPPPPVYTPPSYTTPGWATPVDDLVSDVVDVEEDDFNEVEDDDECYDCGNPVDDCDCYNEEEEDDDDDEFGPAW